MDQIKIKCKHTPVRMLTSKLQVVEISRQENKFVARVLLASSMSSTQQLYVYLCLRAVCLSDCEGLPPYNKIAADTWAAAA